MNYSTLQQDLSLETNGDLQVVLGFAERIRLNTFIDILRNSLLHSDEVISEFEAL